MSNDQNRALYIAFLVSVAAHLALLSVYPWLRERPASPPPPEPLLARLVEPEPVVSIPVPVPPLAETKPEPEPEPPPKPKPAPKPKPTPKPKPAPRIDMQKPAPTPQPQPQPEPQAQLPEQPAPEVVAPAPMSAPAPPQVSASPPVSPPASPAPPRKAEEVASMDTLVAQWRLQVISAARKYKRYPRVAMDNNWEGDVLVRMVIGADGEIAAISVLASSGHRVLDQQAIDMFRQAKPRVPIPSALRGREFAVELRAIYNLRDQDSG